MENKIYKKVKLFGMFWRKNKCYVKLIYENGKKKLILGIPFDDRSNWELIFCSRKSGDIVVHHRDGYQSGGLEHMWRTWCDKEETVGKQTGGDDIMIKD